MKASTRKVNKNLKRVKKVKKRLDIDQIISYISYCVVEKWYLARLII